MGNAVIQDAKLSESGKCFMMVPFLLYDDAADIKQSLWQFFTETRDTVKVNC